MANMSGSSFIAQTLSGYGVTTVFHVPFILDKALVEMEALGIRRVLCHTEKAAAYMADGYARASRKPGIAMAQSVGAANLAAGLQDAYLAMSPVIAITGRWPPDYLYRHAYQEINHWPLYEPVTKFNAYVDTVEQIPIVLRQAFREATGGAPGPVHLDVLGLAGELATEPQADMKVVVEEPFTRYPAFRPEPDPQSLEAAARRLAEATRPVLVAGGGVTASAAAPELVELARMLSIPVATSLNAKGAIAENDPLSVGVVGTYSRRCANEVVSEADLIVFIGSHTGGQVTHFWQVPKAGTPSIQIDIDPSELGRNYPADVAVLGDAKVTLQHLIAALRSCKSDDQWAKRAQQHVKQWRETFEPLLASDAEPIRPERLCRELSGCLGPDAVIVSDTGHAGIWTGAMMELTSPKQQFLRCAGSLGWAFPAAMGAKCAARERPVICFTGDGGLWYHIGELETAVRSGIHVVTVVNNNRSLNQCKPGYDQAYGDRTNGDRGELWKFNDVDFAEVARSMGAFGIRVQRPSDIRGAVERALACDRPALVDVATDIDAFAPTAHVPR